MQQRPNFLTNEYYNPQKLRLKKIKIDKIFTTKIFHNMKKLHKILFLGEKGEGGGDIFPGGQIYEGYFSRGGIFPWDIFPEGIFPSTQNIMVSLSWKGLLFMQDCLLWYQLMLKVPEKMLVD